jgi:hypothetical protein
MTDTKQPPEPLPLEAATAAAFLAAKEVAEQHGLMVAVITVRRDGAHRWHNDNSIVFEGAIRSIMRQLG